MSIKDNYKRTINYLRLSVTDRCNLRCRYCMPADGVAKKCHKEILSYEELYRLSQAAIDLGIEKIRVTGGEPLVRKDILSFLQRLGQLPGLKELVLTTNGILLSQMASDLKEAGVKRLNLSLDSLNSEVFAQITRGGDLSKVLDGIAAAERAGIGLKINMVVMRGINDEEIQRFAAMTRDKPISVRFIEYMPAVEDDGWQKMVLSGQDILKRLAAEFDFEEVPRSHLAGPSKDYRIQGAAGTFGIITPVFDHFCGQCNRIRITSSGTLRSCLFADQETDLKPVLRNGSDDDLRALLQKIIQNKPEGKPLSKDAGKDAHLVMSAVGG